MFLILPWFSIIVITMSRVFPHLISLMQHFSETSWCIIIHVVPCFSIHTLFFFSNLGKLCPGMHRTYRCLWHGHGNPFPRVECGAPGTERPVEFPVVVGNVPQRSKKIGGAQLLGYWKRTHLKGWKLFGQVVPVGTKESWLSTTIHHWSFFLGRDSLNWRISRWFELPWVRWYCPKDDSPGCVQSQKHVWKLQMT